MRQRRLQLFRCVLFSRVLSSFLVASQVIMLRLVFRYSNSSLALFFNFWLYKIFIFLLRKSNYEKHIICFNINRSLLSFNCECFSFKFLMQCSTKQRIACIASQRLVSPILRDSNYCYDVSTYSNCCIVSCLVAKFKQKSFSPIIVYLI